MGSREVSINLNNGNANQGRQNGYDTDPSTVRHNWFWSVYIGPNNPMSYNRLRYDYSTPASGLTDFAAYIHDKRYDALHITGVMGVFTETKALGADYELIGSSLAVFANNYNSASPGDKLTGLAVGVGIFLGTSPKAIAIPFISAYDGFSNWISNTKNITSQGINNFSSNFSHW